MNAEPVTEHTVTEHAAFEMRRRGLSLDLVLSVLRAPEQRSDEQVRQVPEACRMKVTYDQQTDTLTVVLKDGVAVAGSDEDKPGVILDCDERGDLVSLEILDASSRVSEARKVEFQTTPR